MSNQTKSLMEPFIKSLDQMIAQAPDVSPSEETAAATSSTPSFVRLSNGWDAKFLEPLTPKGERWIETFGKAKTAIAAGGIVALIGGRGAGKTSMAAEIARAGLFPADAGEWNGNRAVEGKSAVYIRTLDLFLDLRDAANGKGSSEKQVLAKLEKPGLLIVDEFHERGGSEWENRIVGNLLDKRSAGGRPTLIIANYTIVQLQASLSDSVRDRMRENGKAFVCDWPSYRKGS